MSTLAQDVAAVDATAQAALVRDGQVGPTELVETAIDRIEALNPVLNAVITPTFEGSVDAARAAGEFPNQHEGGDGLPRWTTADRSLVDTDVVLWYTFGVTHFVRPEDWPVMPVEYAGFLLAPVGFFDRNPALDLA